MINPMRILVRLVRNRKFLEITQDSVQPYLQLAVHAWCTYKRIYFTCIYTFIYIYVYVHVYSYIYIYIYVYMYTWHLRKFNLSVWLAVADTTFQSLIYRCGWLLLTHHFRHVYNPSETETCGLTSLPIANRIQMIFT